MPGRGDYASTRQIVLPVMRVFADRPEGRPPVFRPGGGPGLPNHVIIPNASHVVDMWGLQPQAITRLVAGFLATGNVAAPFDAAVPPLEPALRLPTAARLAAGGLLAAAARRRSSPPRGGNAATIDNSRPAFRGRMCRHRGRTEQHEGPSEGAYAAH